jgi:hypothetical protein
MITDLRLWIPAFAGTTIDLGSCLRSFGTTDEHRCLALAAARAKVDLFSSLFICVHLWFPFLLFPMAVPKSFGTGGTVTPTRVRSP